MTTIVWDAIDARNYEIGVSHGVFYPIDGVGVGWSGLILIEEAVSGNDESAFYLDSIKYLSVLGNTEYQATVTAYSAPPDFAPYQGQRAWAPGLILTAQPKKRFYFTYRTETDDGYKIHLVYNVLATPTSNSYSTVTDQAAASTFSWQFDATPIVMAGYRPSAHFVVDSSLTPSEVLVALETFLYGDSDTDPAFPTVDDLVAIFL